MTALTFTLPPSQRRSPIIAAVVAAVVALVAALVGVTVLTGLGCVVAAALVLSYLLVLAGSFSRFDEHGIQSKRGVFRHEAAWENVRDIKPDPRSGEVLLVYLHQGKPFKLGAPASAPLAKDPDYQAKYEQIRQFAGAYIG